MATDYTLYTHHGCGWSHRVHITLSILEVEPKEVHIDLNTPRPEWFLRLNPRGVVPVLKYDYQVLTESALIVQFLVDMYINRKPSFYPPITDKTYIDPVRATARFRMNFMVDTYFTKINPLMFKLVGNPVDSATAHNRVDELVATVKTEIEPLLVANQQSGTRGDWLIAPGDGDGPFWDGNEELTYVEAMTAPFIIRLYRFADDIIWPSSLVGKLDEIPCFSAWAHASMENEIVRETWHEEELLAGTHAKLDLVREKYKDV